MTAARQADSGFWDVGGYKSNVRRIRDGADHLDEYAKMIKERVDIEQKYGKSLQSWHLKWAQYADQRLNEPIVKDSWAKLVDEAKELAKTHLAVKDRCVDELLKTIQLYRKENFHQSAIRGFKEAKEIEDEFEKAQRPWKKLYEKVEATKKAYYLACRTEKSTSIQLMNLQGDSSTANESTEKVKERYEKCKDDVNKTRQAYTAAVNELHQYSPVYNENMAFVFEKCQQMESKRVRFAMEMLSGLQQILVDLANPVNLSKMFGDIGESQIQDCLKSWAKMHGIEQTLSVPEYEEYTPEMRQINNQNKQSKKGDSGGVVLMKQKITSDELPGTPTIAASLERQTALQKYPENRKSTLMSTPSTTSHEQKRLRKDHTLPDSPSMKRAPSTDSSMVSIHTSLHQDSLSTTHSWHKARTISFDEVRLDENKNNSLVQTRPSDRDSLEDDDNLDKTFIVEAQKTVSVSAKVDKQTVVQEKRSFVNSPFADPFPMPTPNRALMNAQGDTFSPIARNANHRNPNLPIGPSLKNMLAMEKKEQQQHQSYTIQEQSSPKSQSDSGHSNGSGESDATNSMPRGPARVLYDYSPIEDDEIPLVKGEILEVLHGPDELGWCYGRKGGIQGLFPASYVAVI